MLIPQRIVPLDWHISRLKNKEYYSFVRWGDGEMKALTLDSGNTKGHGKYQLSPWTKKTFNQALLKYYQEENLIFSCPDRMLTWMNKQSRPWLKKRKLLGIEWVNCTMFKGASAQGRLFPLIEELRTQKVIVIGPKFLRILRKSVFNYLDFIEIHPKKGYLDKTVLSRVFKSQEKYGNGIVYSFSAGIGTNMFIPNLHRRMSGNFLIDFGSVWDIFCGVRSRGYMKLVHYSKETILKNLGITAKRNA